MRPGGQDDNNPERTTLRKTKLPAAALAAILFFAIVPQAAADDVIVPSWVKWDAAKQETELGLKAAYNGNNGSWNWNGYYEGGITVVVPLGSKLVVHFENSDGNYAHSLLVTRAYGEDEFPDQAGREEVALSRAYTRSPTQGCLSCSEDLRFKAKKAGMYYLYCGIEGHGPAGMWIGFEVSESATEASMAMAGGVPAEDDQPPWE